MIQAVKSSDLEKEPMRNSGTGIARLTSMPEENLMFEEIGPHSEMKDTQRKLKVLLVSTNADYAGAPIHVATLVRKLQERADFQIVFGEDGPVAEEMKGLGIVSHLIPRMSSKISPISDLVSAFQLLRVVQGFHPDLIHAHSTKAGMLARVVGMVTRVPVIFTVHGWGWRGFSPVKRKIIVQIERLLVKIRRSHLIFVSNSVKAEGRLELGDAVERGLVIHNGVDPVITDPKPEAEQLRIIMPARVSAAKDHKTLFEAFEMLDERFRLVLCGEGTASPEFRNFAKESAPSMSKNIDFLGARSDVHQLLESAQGFALISHFEALPLSIIEAMSAGLPIVASNVGGVSELIKNGYSGILVEPNNASDLSLALRELVDRDKRETLSRNAQEDYHRYFTSEAMANGTYQAYLDVAAR